VRSWQWLIDGVPKGQPRARSFVVRGKGGKPILTASGDPIVRVHEAGTAENWKSLIADACRKDLPPQPMTSPVLVELHFYLPRPKSKCRRKDPDGSMPCTSKPDCDNLAKAAIDALTQLGWWGDDAQIAYLAVSKNYHGKGGRPGARIVIIEQSTGGDLLPAERQEASDWLTFRSGGSNSRSNSERTTGRSCSGRLKRSSTVSLTTRNPRT